jgi:hypothetical protein
MLLAAQEYASVKNRGNSTLRIEPTGSWADFCGIVCLRECVPLFGVRRACVALS